MGAKSVLSGSIISRKEKRRLDQRAEPRDACPDQAALLTFRGQAHIVPLVNLSDSGAAFRFALPPNIGETVRLQLFDHEEWAGTVCWVRDGKVGIDFAA